MAGEVRQDGSFNDSRDNYHDSHHGMVMVNTEHLIRIVLPHLINVLEDRWDMVSSPPERHPFSREPARHFIGMLAGDGDRDILDAVHVSVEVQNIIAHLQGNAPISKDVFDITRRCRINAMDQVQCANDGDIHQGGYIPSLLQNSFERRIMSGMSFHDEGIGYSSPVVLECSHQFSFDFIRNRQLRDLPSDELDELSRSRLETLAINRDSLWSQLLVDVIVNEADVVDNEREDFEGAQSFGFPPADVAILPPQVERAVDVQTGVSTDALEIRRFKGSADSHPHAEYGYIQARTQRSEPFYNGLHAGTSFCCLGCKGTRTSDYMAAE